MKIRIGKNDDKAAASAPASGDGPGPEDAALQARLQRGEFLPVGEIVVKKNRMSPSEQALLTKIGVKDGDTVPSNLAELAEQAKIALLQEAMNPTLPVDPKKPPVKLDIRQIEDLPPDQQARYYEILKSMTKDYKEAMASQRQQEARQPSPVFNPETNLQPTMLPESMRHAKFTSLDDELAKAFPSAPAQPTPKPEPEPEPPKTEEPNNEPASSTGELTIKRCPMCEHPVDIKPPWLDPKPEDIREFALSLLADEPYRRTFKLMNGAIVVEFRTLTMAENEEMQKQLACDFANGIKLIDKHMELFGKYRLAMQMRSLIVKDRIYALATSLNDFDIDPELLKTNTRVKYAAEYLLGGEAQDGTSKPGLVTGEHLYRTIMHYNTQFNQIAQTLWLRCQSPNFSVEI